jgi:hypothetical protein
MPLPPRKRPGRAAVHIFLFLFAFTACGTRGPVPVEPRAVFELAHIIANDGYADAAALGLEGSRLIFVGEESGGNVIIRLGDTNVQAAINPDRGHPSFASGYWHHHLYAGATAAGSPRINFMALLPHLNIDDNPGATDNTQSVYQRGNLHYIVESGLFRLRLTMGGTVHDLIFAGGY